jgi:hypothetical protein
MDTRPESAEDRAITIDRLLRDTSKKKPKVEDVQALRRYFVDTPELWKAVSLAQNVALAVMEHETELVGQQVVLKANYDGQKRALGYAAAPPLEKLLIEHVALCWLRLQRVEQRYSAVMAQSITLTMGDYWERRLSAAQRRYLRACETLARVRRLRLPALQVNIGEKQVNVAGPVSVAGGIDEQKVIDP